MLADCKFIHSRAQLCRGSGTIHICLFLIWTSHEWAFGPLQYTQSSVIIYTFPLVNSQSLWVKLFSLANCTLFCNSSLSHPLRKDSHWPCTDFSRGLTVGEQRGPAGATWAFCWAPWWYLGPVYLAVSSVSPSVFLPYPLANSSVPWFSSHVQGNSGRLERQSQTSLSLTWGLVAGPGRGRGHCSQIPLPIQGLAPACYPHLLIFMRAPRIHFFWKKAT